MPTGSYLLSITLNLTLEIKRPIRSSSRSIKPTMLSAMSTRGKTMTIWCLERWFLWELIIYLMTSSETDGLVSKMSLSSQFSIINGLKTWISFWNRIWMIRILMKGKRLKHHQFTPTKMENKPERLWLQRKLLRMARLRKRRQKIICSPLVRGR